MSSFKNFRKMEIDSLWLLRIFTIIPVLLILMAGAGALWIYFFVLSLLPSGESLVDLPGLSAAVKVVRDKRGVPGILGDKEEDVVMVLGYVMAQDRLWQMDYLRKASQGRLAEVLGPAYLDGDHLMRTVRAGRSKGDLSAELGEAERVWLDRFVAGVNTYINTHAAKPPIEFSLLEYRPEPFTRNDVLGICMALAWESSVAQHVDPVLTRVLGRLGKDRALALFPTDPAAAPGMVVSDLVGWEPEGLLFNRSGDRADLLRFPGFRGGCAWTVGRTRTRSGQPMLGCMVYQVLSAPGFWYRARLVAGDMHLSGAFVPGLPVALAGTNRTMSWGCVSAPADDADLFVERLDEAAPNRYWRIDRWRPVKEFTENYRIKGRSSVSKPVRLTDTGPLVSDVNKGRALSLRWAGRNATPLYSAFFALNRAGNAQDVFNALKGLDSPCLNVAWAEAGGGCGIQVAGRVPVRPSGADGIVPMPAWTGAHDWSGFIPFAELPARTDPASGLAAVADGRPGGLTYPLFLGCYWDTDGRRERITELLGETVEQSRDTFAAVQKDNLSPFARDVTPLVVKAVSGDDGADTAIRKAVEVLSGWNFQMKADSAGAALFALLYQALLEEMFLKPLGEKDFLSFTDHQPLAARMVRKVFVDGDTKWLNGAPPEQVLRKSFQQAVKRGRSLMGGNPADWKWGKIHNTVFVHPLTTRSRFLELLYHVGPVPLPGSGDTLDYAAWSRGHPFRVVGGVSLRQVSDMSRPPELFGISPMGVSAHFFSTHYKDQTIAWARGLSFREPVERSEISQSGLDTVLFNPRREERLSQR